MDQPQAILIQELSKYFGPVKAVNGISFEVYQGEIFGFLGPNGAGKTTTIRMMFDLLRPDAGRIELLGHPLHAYSREIRSRCGYLPGNFSAYGNLTGRQFLNFCADLRSMSRKIDDRLTGRFGLTAGSLGQRIKHLSHGTRQKLGIIQAFFHNPELLILDEPTIGLDPLMQEEFYRLLDEHNRRGATIFLSSHNLSEVERICHRMAIIRNGEIVAADSIENLRRVLKKKLRFTLSRFLEEVTLPGAEFISRQGQNWEFLILSDIGPVLKALSELPIADLSLPEPGLEEIFMSYYQELSHD
jgi:ABC-2 type transport system ATP-binding protein